MKSKFTIYCSKWIIEILEKGSHLTIKTPERRLWIYFTAFSTVSIIDFEQVNVSGIASC